ncbi:hypothetical protein [Maricaulis sp.]|uniref:hypothetical protein n=1 Tax=Maricaulis sp. TaxID=1486257 RepID=UPI003A8F73F6
MRYGALVLILILAASLPSAAHANCRWEVHGRMEGILNGVGNIAGQRWPAANLEVRVQARTPGGLWNQPNWPATRTDAQGRWSVSSAIAFADPDCQNNRSFRVQIRAYTTGNQWRTLHQQSVSGPAGMAGLMNPAPVHSSALGLLILSDDGSSENGVIQIEGLDPPRTELSSPDQAGGTGDDGTLSPTGDTGNDDPPDDDGTDHEVTMEDAPCGMLTASLPGRVEFRFGQLPPQPGPLSFDQALNTQTRANGAGTMTLNRLRNLIRVENAGSRDYRARDDCPAVVHFRINEGPGRRGSGDDAWSNPATIEIPDIAVNATAPLARDANLLGAGDVFSGAWAEQWDGGASHPRFYQYVLIEVSLDATHAVFETAETDNVITHCYHAPERQFVDLALCQTD